MRSGGRRGKQGSSAVRLIGVGQWRRLVAERRGRREEQGRGGAGHDDGGSGFGSGDLGGKGFGAAEAEAWRP